LTFAYLFDSKGVFCSGCGDGIRASAFLSGLALVRRWTGVTLELVSVIIALAAIGSEVGRLLLLFFLQSHS